ncbi:MAG: Uridine nucleosidase 1 [Stictis urceolatum]|nr:Uridine nucleosidase 1 [Stictis urceolata]
MPPIPLWLDCDPGHDDAFALLLAAHHPSLHLLGVSTVHGNASLARTTSNAGSVLTAIGRADVPVYPGAAKPFCRDAVCAPDIHGETGLDGTTLLPAPSRAPQSGSAIQATSEALFAQEPGTAWVVATGALTNIALLFASFPGLAGHVAGLSVMGGAVGAGFTAAQMGVVGGEGGRFGNVTPWAEFNVYCDPESAHSLLSNPVLASKTTLVTLDLTHLVLATPEIQARLSGGTHEAGSELRQMLLDLLTFFANTYSTVFGISAGPPLHDPLAVAVLLEALLGDGKRVSGAMCFDDRGGERFAVRAVTDGTHGGDGEGTVGAGGKVGQVGRTVVEAIEGQGVRIPRAVDLEWFWNEMLEAVGRAERAVGQEVA